MNPATIVNYIYIIYEYLVQFIAHLLQITIFQADPSIATEYAKFISFLIPLTAIYIILVFATAFKKIIGYALLFGWGFILLMLILAKVSGGV